MFPALVITLYITVPLVAVSGWARWAKQRHEGGFFSLIAFAFGTASALLAVGTAGYAAMHRFEYYDPVLLTIFVIGDLISLLGVGFSLLGIIKPGVLRWHAFVLPLGMLFLWLAWRAME